MLWIDLGGLILLIMTLIWHRRRIITQNLIVVDWDLVMCLLTLHSLILSLIRVLLYLMPLVKNGRFHSSIILIHLLLIIVLLICSKIILLSIRVMKLSIWFLEILIWATWEVWHLALQGRKIVGIISAGFRSRLLYHWILIIEIMSLHRGLTSMRKLWLWHIIYLAHW